jgi:phenylpyruvate tautomerase PptA (4-oxalocrotonate tautomerase family)
MDKIEEKELKKLLNEVTRLYKKHLKQGYEYIGVMFEDCQDGNEIQEVLMFAKQ